MGKVNTFFAAATWYNDDDSEPYHYRTMNALKGVRCPRPNGAMTHWTDRPGHSTAHSYLLDPVRSAVLKERNDRLLQRRKEEAEERERRFQEIQERKREHRERRKIIRQLADQERSQKRIINKLFDMMHWIVRSPIFYEEDRVGMNFDTTRSWEEHWGLRLTLKRDFKPYLSMDELPVGNWKES